MSRLAISNIILCLIAANLLAQPYSCSSEHKYTAQANTSPFQNNQEPQTNTSKESSLHWYTSSEWWLVIIAALTGLAISYQAWEMRKATEEMTKQAVEMRRQRHELRRQGRRVVERERARLLVDPCYTGNLSSILKPRSDEIPILEETAIEIHQHGPTKAFNVTGFAKAQLTTSQDPPEMKDMYRLDIPTIVDRTDDKPIVANVYIPVSREEEIEAIRDKRLYVHLFGVITYDDVFGDPHRTPFRYIWKVDVHWEPPDEPVDRASEVDDSGWELHGPPEDNYAT